MNQKELRELENQCIQEHVPACVAACPVHVDVREICRLVEQGDFQGAYAQYRKAIPFPGIVSRICDQPCKATCIRKDLGGAIEIAALERACVTYGSVNAKPVTALPRKNKKVAVIGAGISGLTAAHDLARKGWGVEIYESSDRIGGGLWMTPPDLLPRDVLRQDLAVVEQMDVCIHLNAPVCQRGGNGHATTLNRLSDEFDAVYLSCGIHTTDVKDLALDASGNLVYDEFTFQTSLPKVFAGGDVLHIISDYPEQVEHSVIRSISHGRRAAVSIDRFLQNVSLTAARTNEGPYTTRLYTSTEGISEQACLVPTTSASMYNEEVAETEAARCIQCECMECVKVCPYLDHYHGYPKKYIREIYNNLSIVMGTRYSNQFINSCALCGLCAEVCPEDVDMGMICRDARQTMVEQKRMPASAHDFALRDMAFSNGEKFLLARHAPGANNSTMLFFPGCQLSAAYPAYVEKMYDFLRSTYGENKVGLMLRCCGAPADWAGRKDLFSQANAELVSAVEALGNPQLVVACSSCYQVFKEHLPALNIVSFWELFDQNNEKFALAQPDRLPISVHDPCSTRYEGGIQNAIRSILSKGNIPVEELALNREKTECCSYGGVMWLANRDVARKMVEQRIQESELDYLTYCAMCRDYFARQGKRTLHILDLLFGEKNIDFAAMPAIGFSQRHENRARLKEKLLKERWKEVMPDKQAYEHIKLILPEAIQKLVDDRLILVEDMQKVIAYAEESGKRMQHAQTGHYLAYYKPNYVTYWVEYTPDGDAYLIHKAYSHRMEIGKGMVS